MKTRVLVLALASLGWVSLPLAAQEEGRERRVPELAADLDALIKVATIWATSSDGLEMLYTPRLDDPKAQKKPPQFEWMNAEKSRARFSRHMFSNVETKLTMFGGSIKVEEAVLEFLNGKVAKTTISFYNRGDSGDIGVKDFDRIFKTIGQNLGQVLKVAPKRQLNSTNAALPVAGWMWGVSTVHGWRSKKITILAQNSPHTERTQLPMGSPVALDLTPETTQTMKVEKRGTNRAPSSELHGVVPASRCSI